jgi:hypothetical protein
MNTSNVYSIIVSQLIYLVSTAHELHILLVQVHSTP